MLALRGVLLGGHWASLGLCGGSLGILGMALGSHWGVPLMPSGSLAVPLGVPLGTVGSLAVPLGVPLWGPLGPWRSRWGALWRPLLPNSYGRQVSPKTLNAPANSSILSWIQGAGYLDTPARPTGWTGRADPANNPPHRWLLDGCSRPPPCTKKPTTNHFLEPGGPFFGGLVMY